MGNKVDPRYAQHTPSVWWPTEEGGLYTLMMVGKRFLESLILPHHCGAKTHWAQNKLHYSLIF